MTKRWTPASGRRRARDGAWEETRETSGLDCRKSGTPLARPRRDATVHLGGTMTSGGMRMNEKNGYPGRLHHAAPPWVEAGALYHVRIRLDAGSHQNMASLPLGRRLLDSVRFYHSRQKWYARLFLLMPDHLHAILCFPTEKGMSTVVGAWKGYHAKNGGVAWQDGYFDHRIRDDAALLEKTHYIRMNPVRAGLCQSPEDWPWVVEPAKEEMSQ